MYSRIKAIIQENELRREKRDIRLKNLREIPEEAFKGQICFRSFGSRNDTKEKALKNANHYIRSTWEVLNSLSDGVKDFEGIKNWEFIRQNSHFVSVLMGDWDSFTIWNMDSEKGPKECLDELKDALKRLRKEFPEGTINPDGRIPIDSTLLTKMAFVDETTQGDYKFVLKK
jgi:hypothetical protein